MSRVVPGHPATSAGLIRDTGGRVLVVRSRGDRWWHLPGGVVEQNETPAAACHREVSEELGLALAVGPLLVVAWKAARTIGRRARFAFVFDLGVHSAELFADHVMPQRRELGAWQWATPRDAVSLLHRHVAQRLCAALRSSQGAVYLEQT
ncbi:NUDIX domain-containing protein [Streptoalloteichus hindustanus]|uniref:NUDIX domain-containing protein n=1 Tax=Streptoalloteichus hindustanus TaxID=2017 RepID=A0A1M5NC82_STRHI|nr:NUDIX hydrolase [Streptoalloteichus hindustanus]SHG86583.1 NUDIX domain-containing protein [Streptoalloteichus hindustanus]